MTHPGNDAFELLDLFEMTLDLVCIAGRDGYFRKVNPAVMDKLEYSRDELFSQPISFFIHPDDKELTQLERNKLLNGKALLNFKNRYVSKTGKIVWLEWTSVYVPDKEVVFAIAKDITESKRKEREIEDMYNKYKSLATHFKSHIEDDRKYLAHELHEELAQLAAVIKMDVAWINEFLSGVAGQAKDRIENALVLSDLLIRAIRRISFSISPNMLNDVGFIATLEWTCKEFSILNGIPCRFTSNCDEADLTKEIKLDFFRICQEALGNIMEHAQAQSVDIDLRDEGKHIILSVRDDGKGFDPGKTTRSVGLKDMQQRAMSINGQLNIVSKKDKGTTITMTVKKET